jgi:hypothetical protein
MPRRPSPPITRSEAQADFWNPTRHHDQPDPCTVLDRVVSSYIPTVRALEHARSRPAVDSAGIVVTAMPNTPGAADLPGVLSETRTLQQRFPNACVLLGHNATRDNVLTQLAQHPIAHFACHANTVATSPSHSHLLLHDDRLTTMDISAQSLIRAKLAYLSACATTETHPALADEAIHITAAFQLAGYAHVIGALWPIMDNIAPVFAALLRQSDVRDRSGCPRASSRRPPDPPGLPQRPLILGFPHPHRTLNRSESMMGDDELLTAVRSAIRRRSAGGWTSIGASCRCTATRYWARSWIPRTTCRKPCCIGFSAFYG